MQFKYLLGVVALLALNNGVTGQGLPWELVLRADPLDSHCTFIAFGRAETHKDLIHEDVVRQVTPIPAPRPTPSANVVRLLSHNAHALALHARPHCSNDFTAAVSAQVDLFGQSQLPWSWEGASVATHALDVDLPPLEVVPLITSGSAHNRIDLAFFGDGYTAAERQRFLDDASRLAHDMSTNQTFFTVKPLLNFWAVFTPSTESGIGVGGKAKDTPFGLYRDGTELRGLYANHSDVALAACASLGNKCNYAILLANDPLYGGIGGEYTTTTASLANGALVLRHEIGHSMIDVGEEYDGGFAYFGANAIHDPGNVTWAHWLSDANPRIEHSVMPMQAYPWTLLEVEAPWLWTFSSSGRYARHLVKFSLSGIPRAEDLAVSLDGVDLGWTPRPDIGVDRWHYDLFFDHTLAEGERVIKFALQNGELQGQAQLCSVEILEYGSPEEFNATRGHYSLFPTYDLDNNTSYRPTNDDCVMRTVAQPNFCSVCLEALWLSLLRRVDLIDDLRVTCSDHEHVVDIDLVALAQFRKQPVERAESYAIEWTQDGRVLEAFANHTRAEIDGAGTYRVDVVYTIDEVRVDPRGYLHASRTFDVDDAC